MIKVSKFVKRHLQTNKKHRKNITEHIFDSAVLMESDSAVSMTPRRFLNMKISPRNQNHVQKYFTIWKEAIWVKILKKLGSKISLHWPFKSKKVIRWGGPGRACLLNMMPWGIYIDRGMAEIKVMMNCHLGCHTAKNQGRSRSLAILHLGHHTA